MRNDDEVRIPRLSSILLAVQIFCARQLKQVALGTGQEFSGSFNFCVPNERLFFVIYFYYMGSPPSTVSIKGHSLCKQCLQDLQFMKKGSF